MVDIYRQNLQEASFTGGRDGIRRMVCVGPCIGAVRKSTVGEMVDDALVWVFFGSHEYEADDCS